VLHTREAPTDAFFGLVAKECHLLCAFLEPLLASIEARLHRLSRHFKLVKVAPALLHCGSNFEGLTVLIWLAAESEHNELSLTLQCRDLDSRH